MQPGTALQAGQFIEKKLQMAKKDQIKNYARLIIYIVHATEQRNAY